VFSFAARDSLTIVARWAGLSSAPSSSGQIAGQALSATVLMRHESDGLDFLQILSRSIYLILFVLTIRNLND
jgi:hypothetical protein